MRFRAVLFDLDGTLLDTVDDLADSANAIFERAGFPQHPISAYKIFVGEGLRRFVERALPEASLDEETILRTMGEMREEYGRRWADKTRPYDGVESMLDRLGELGVRASVLSNKPDEFTKKCVAKLLPGRAFEIVMGARDGTPRKPDPAGAVEIASRMGLEPAEFLYLGDTNIDMRTAIAAGMFAVGALWGFRDEAELREAGAQELVRSPAEVLALLE
ncbi:MAG: HAD family hydrolase [Planctomycetota bacterium]|jgi:phosphoglycolate phosphatase